MVLVRQHQQVLYYGFPVSKDEGGPINVSLNGSPLSQVTSLKHLGVTINEFLSNHVDVYCRKAAQ